MQSGESEFFPNPGFGFADGAGEIQEDDFAADFADEVVVMLARAVQFIVAAGFMQVDFVNVAKFFEKGQ